MMSVVEQIKAWAEKNYHESYGASCLVECYDDHELAEQFDSLRDAIRFARLQDEMYMNARCDM